jgi:hypothetical protein
VDPAEHVRRSRLDFAEDLVLLSHCPQDILKSKQISVLATKGKQIGLNIKTTKTKITKLNTRISALPITHEGKQIEEVQEFIYLGYKITLDGNSEKHILTCCIALARECVCITKEHLEVLQDKHQH